VSISLNISISPAAYTFGTVVCCFHLFLNTLIKVASKLSCDLILNYYPR
jgi:hypothetical protein